VGQLITGGWTEAQSEALKAHIGSGLSYAAAARRINEEFQTAYSRNAAIGRANRIGLATPDRPPGQKSPRIYKPREHKPRLRVVRANSNSGRLRVIQVSETEQFEPVTDEALDAAARHIGFDALTNETCKWPYGDGPFTFCGCAKISDGPYCYGHQIRSQRASYHINLSEESRKTHSNVSLALLEKRRRSQHRQRRGVAV
jgi:GcrA cell cycle regulator